MFSTKNDKLSAEEENIELRMRMVILNYELCQLKATDAKKNVQIVHLKRQGRIWKQEHNVIL